MLSRASPDLSDNLAIVDPSKWEGRPVPDREWIVPGWIPAKAPTLLSGDGAAGKTTAGLQLGVARAVGKDWFGTVPAAGRTLFLSAEDDEEELHRRVDAIRQHYGVGFAELGDFRLVDLVGRDAVLGSLTRNGLVQATPLLRQVEHQIETFKPDLAVIDALADAFAGDENNRSQARQFIGLLKQLGRRWDCAFLCLAHPSLTGMSTGSGMSGSTAWSNSVRSRLYFENAKAGDGSEPDADLRTLSVRKANYAASGATVTVRWKAGAYVVEGGVSSLDRLAQGQRAKEKFLDLLRTFNLQGQDVSAKVSSSYAPARFARHPKAEGIGKKLFETAMQHLLGEKLIRIEVTGSPSRQRSRLVVGGEE